MEPAAACQLFWENSLQPAKAHPHPRLPATLAAVGLRGHKAVGPGSLYHSPDQCRALTYLAPIPNWQAGQFPRNRNRCAGVPAPARSDGGRTAGSGTSRPSRGQNFHGSLSPRPWEERFPEVWIGTGSWAGAMVSWLRDWKTGDEGGGMRWTSHNRPCAL